MSKELSETVFGHPRGLFLLASAQFWERFSFYGILGILVLYLVARPVDGGLGWLQPDALKLVGIFSGLSFALPFVGGLVSSLWLGERRCITIGSIAIVSGHVALAAQSAGGASMEFRNSALYIALALIAIGIGFLKPTITSMVARLYPQGGERKDSGFIIFMMCIYAGSFLSFIIVGALAQSFGWAYGFGAASIGMAIGYSIYLLYSHRLLGDLGIKADSSQPARDDDSSPRGGIMLIAIFSFFTLLYATCFFQATGIFSLILERQIDRSVGGFVIPVPWFIALVELFFVLFGPFAAWLNRAMAQAGKPLDVLSKQAIGLALMALIYLILWWPAVVRSSHPEIKTSMLPFVTIYILMGMADLFIWPVQLSAVTSLAPNRSRSLFVGIWWVAAGAGIFLTGYVAGLSEWIGVDGLFLGLSALCALSAVIVLLIRIRLRPLLAVTRSTFEHVKP